jgi:hypothetical protein
MDFDLVLRDVRPADAKSDRSTTDIGVKDGPHRRDRAAGERIQIG